MNLNDLLLELPIVIRNRFAANNYAQWVKMCNRAINEINRTCAGPGRMITVSPNGSGVRALQVPKQIETVNAVFVDGEEVDFAVKNRIILVKDALPDVIHSGSMFIQSYSTGMLDVTDYTSPFTPAAGDTIELPNGIIATALAYMFGMGGIVNQIAIANAIPDLAFNTPASVYQSTLSISGYERIQPISSVSETICLPEGYEGMMVSYLRYYAELQDDEGSRTADKWLNEALRFKSQFMSVQTKAEGKSAPKVFGFGFRRSR